jgi:hypothetical protein
LRYSVTEFRGCQCSILLYPLKGDNLGIFMLQSVAKALKSSSRSRRATGTQFSLTYSLRPNMRMTCPYNYSRDYCIYTINAFSFVNTFKVKSTPLCLKYLPLYNDLYDNPYRYRVLIRRERGANRMTKGLTWFRCLARWAWPKMRRLQIQWYEYQQSK